MPSPLGECVITDVIPNGSLSAIGKITHFAVEELRSARRYLSKAGFRGEIDRLNFYLINEHSKPDAVDNIISVLTSGIDVALLSEAGLPAIADPGANLVSAAHKHRIVVKPLPGPSSIFLALMASGKNGQNFAFVGYLPVKVNERRLRIKELESISLRQMQSQIFIETPYRNNMLIKDILEVCNVETTLTIASELTTPFESVITKSIRDWRKEIPNLNKKPCVFIL